MHLIQIRRIAAVVACCAAWNEGEAQVRTQTQPPRRVPPATTPARGAVQGTELVIATSDEGCDAPDQVDAGLINVRLFNRGTALRHVELIKVDRERLPQIREYVLANDRNVPWMHALGGPAPAPPGGVSSTTMVLQPGRHVLSCIVPGSPTNRQSFPDGVIKDLLVTTPPGPSRPVSLPAAEHSLRMFEWNFLTDGPLLAGRRTVRVENAGKLAHNLWIVRLAPGRTADQVAAWITDPRGVPPFEAVGGSTELEKDKLINITVDLLAGDYVFLCTLYNPLSRRTHVSHGMMKVVRVGA